MAFVDANIILELLIPGRRHAEAVAEVLGSTEQLHTSMLSAHIVWYFGRHAQIADTTISRALADYQLVDLLAEDYSWAVTNEASKDFEDALQVSMALRTQAKTFITLDTRLAKSYRDSGLEFLLPH